MVTKKNNDGGSAFPHAQEHMVCGIGMSLRDWFAGQALAVSFAQSGDWDSFKQIAEASYEVADAMLAAREAKATA